MAKSANVGGISGFPELLPAEQIVFADCLAVIRRQFERHGYVPLDLPLVERSETLGAKSGGEIAKQIYGLRLLNPGEGDDAKDLALRFDHTVPLARYVAQHQGELDFPFRRYAMGPVFRGERAQAGRYRQFWQCDVDAVGRGSLNPLHDAEMVAIIAGIFRELAIGPFTIRVGNRRLLNSLFMAMGVNDQNALAEALRVIDRLEKVGPDAVLNDLNKIGNLNILGARKIMEILSMSGSNNEKISEIGSLVSIFNDYNGTLFNEGYMELKDFISSASALGVGDNNCKIDLSIARGLDYYSGTVYETRLDDHPKLGSIASGGRYDQLAESFGGQAFPGVGMSIGLTRLLIRLLDAGLVKAERRTMAPVLVTCQDLAGCRDDYLRIAAELRKKGVGCEVYLEDKGLKPQLKFAARRGFRLAVIAARGELDAGQVILRDLSKGEQQLVARGELPTEVQKILSVG